MKERLLSLWEQVTGRRYRSELKALRRARLVPQLAIFPIGLNVAFWWFALCIPSLVPYALGHILIEGDSTIAKGFGYAMLASTQIYALVVLCVAAPWFFRWYFIAVGLMIGRSAMADRKEAELITAIGPAKVS